MLVTAATDLQKDIVEGGRVSWCHPKNEIAGQAQIFSVFLFIKHHAEWKNVGKVMIIKKLIPLHINM